MQKRLVEFDILRALLILSAIFLHFNAKFDLGHLAVISVFIQKNIMTVGSFFLFTAGVMANRIYKPRLEIDKAKNITHIIIKGVTILFIYFIYVFVLRLLNKELTTASSLVFLFKHGYFVKILFTFGLLYILSPFLILFFQKTKNLLFFILTLYVLLVLLLYLEKNIFLIFLIYGDDYTYPIIPALIVFNLGLLTEKLNILKKTASELLTTLPLYFFLIIYFAFRFIEVTSVYYHNFPVDPIRETFFIIILLKLVRRILDTRHFLSSMFSNDVFLSFGRKSLTSYVAANFLIGLIRFENQSKIELIIMLLIVCVFSWVITYWHYQSDKFSRGYGH